MKGIFVLLLLAVASVNCFAIDQNVVQFLEGVGEGIEADFGNITACVSEENTVLSDFNLAYSEIRSGIHHLDLNELAKGIRELSAGVREVSIAMKTCGLATLAVDVEAIANKLESGPTGWVELLAKEALNIFSHLWI